MYILQGSVCFSVYHNLSFILITDIYTFLKCSTRTQEKLAKVHNDAERVLACP